MAANNDNNGSSAATAKRLAALEAVVKELPASVPMDYHHDCVPKGLLKYAIADRGHKSGLLQVALGAATTQVFGRPFDGFSEDEVRCAFHLGDKDSVPQSPPRKGGKESLPRPLYRRFFRPAPLSEEEEVALRHKELAEEQLRRPAHEAEQERQQRQAEGPPAKRVKGEPSPPPPPPPAPAPAPAPVAPPLPPPPAPALVLPSLEAAPVDVSQLAALRRRVSELTQPEVLTIAEEITKKLKAKRMRAWGKGNPLETEITRENCAGMGIPGYFDVIETPMNLTLIMRKIRGSEYTALKEFCADVELMVDNALTFNLEGQVVHTFAKETRELFYKQLRKHKEEYALRDDEE